MENIKNQFQPLKLVCLQSLFMMGLGVPVLIYGLLSGVHLVVASKVLGPVIFLFIFMNLSFLSVWSLLKKPAEKREIVKLNILVSVSAVLLSVWRFFDFYTDEQEVMILLLTQSIVILLVGVLWTFSASVSFHVSPFVKTQFEKYPLPKLVFRILKGLAFLVGASVLIWGTFLVIYIPLFM